MKGTIAREWMGQREKHFLRPEKALGQFLTPPEIAEFMVNFISPPRSKRKAGIDPSCGDGVFLKALLKAGFSEVMGIDIDEQILEKLSPLKAKVFVGNGLLPLLGDIDSKANVVVGNPPFSAKYGRVKNQNILSLYELGKGKTSQAIEVLFLERFLQLASPQGYIGIILPAGILSSLPLKYVREFILKKAKVLGIISLPRGIFKGKTSSKTCILFAQKGEHEGKTFVGIAKELEALPLLLDAYKNRKNLNDPLARWVELKIDSFEPEFYLVKKSPVFPFPAAKLEEFLDDIHSGSTEYGEKRFFVEAGIPFVSAKVVTWLGIDFSKDKRFVKPGSFMDKKQAYTKVGDVLFVRVGVGCSGRAAVVSEPSEEGIADDWIYILRPKGISPYYLALFFATKQGKAQIESIKRGVGTVTIPQSLLKQILVPILPLSFQEELERGYKEMISFRKEGQVSKAREKFESMVGRLKNLIGGYYESQIE